MLSKITYMHVGGAERLPLLPWRLGQAQCIIIKYIHCGARDGTASNQMQSINSFSAMMVVLMQIGCISNLLGYIRYCHCGLTSNNRLSGMIIVLCSRALRESELPTFAMAFDCAYLYSQTLQDTDMSLFVSKQFSLPVAVTLLN